MKITLTTDEMLAQWKLRRGFAPLRANCVIERSDGVDLDAILRLEMRDWYLNLLDNAPIEMLAPSDIKDSIAIIKQYDGSGVVTLPENCRRVVEFQLKGWRQPAKIITDLNSHEAMLQTNKYSRAKSQSPIVVKHHNKLLIYSLPNDDNPTIERALAILEPADGSYTLDERGMNLIRNEYSVS
jgi:hypothetical protein